jgi:hypothetical protein
MEGANTSVPAFLSKAFIHSKSSPALGHGVYTNLRSEIRFFEILPTLKSHGVHITPSEWLPNLRPKV